MLDFLRQRRLTEEERRQERVNAYLDGELSAAERQRFERELDQDAALRREVNALQAVKRSLQQVPRLRAPRSFTLDPARYGKPAPAARLFPVLRAATAFAALFVVILLGVGLLDTGLAPGVDATAAVALEAQSAAEFSADEARVVGEEAAEEGAPAAALAVPAATATAEDFASAAEAEEAADEEMAEEPVAEGSAAQPTGEGPAAAAPPADTADATLEAVTPSTNTLGMATAAPTTVAPGEEVGQGDLVAPRPEAEALPDDRAGVDGAAPDESAVPGGEPEGAIAYGISLTTLQWLTVLAGVIFLGLFVATLIARRAAR